jgi:hypothetical protein
MLTAPHKEQTAGAEWQQLYASPQILTRRMCGFTNEGK